MALTDLEGNVVLATATINALSGKTKIRVDGFTTGKEYAVLHEETNTGGVYAPVMYDGQALTFDMETPSMVLELYGNYKLLFSSSALSAGYAAAA